MFFCSLQFTAHYGHLASWTAADSQLCPQMEEKQQDGETQTVHNWKSFSAWLSHGCDINLPVCVLRIVSAKTSCWERHQSTGGAFLCTHNIWCILSLRSKSYQEPIKCCDCAFSRTMWWTRRTWPLTYQCSLSRWGRWKSHQATEGGCKRSFILQSGCQTILQLPGHSEFWLIYKPAEGSVDVLLPLFPHL